MSKIDDILNDRQMNLFGEMQVSEEKMKLQSEYIIPPFSFLDTRQGYWEDRKLKWRKILGRGNAGRAKNLTFGTFDMSKYSGDWRENGTSSFDPVLVEIMYRWFSCENWAILDPFSGGIIGGGVSSLLNRKYIGFELRKEQIETNMNKVNELGLKDIIYINDDSNNLDKYLKDNSIDFIFTCPPYFDLEKYSDDEKDLSNMDWETFKVSYENILTKACKTLKDNRFVGVVLSDIRDKKEFYRGLPRLTDEIFEKNGLGLYDEFVEILQSSSGAVRVRKQFRDNRKVIRNYQIVKIYYKGNPKDIKKNFPTLKELGV